MPLLVVNLHFLMSLFVFEYCTINVPMFIPLLALVSIR